MVNKKAIVNFYKEILGVSVSAGMHHSHSIFHHPHHHNH